MKTRNKNFLILLLSILLIYSAEQTFAQVDIFSKSDWLKSNIKPESEPNLLYFNSGNGISALNLFEEHKADFGLTDDDQMNLYKTDTDQIGFIHYRYQQYYKDVKIEYAQFFVHENDGSITTASGLILNNVNMSVTPIIQPSSVFMLASVDDTSIQLISEVELLITCVNNQINISTDNLILAYRIEVKTFDNLRLAIYIDALNGNVLKRISLTNNCSVGVCQTLYNGQQNINSLWTGSLHKYELTDDCHGVGIHTFLYGQNHELRDDDNQWSAVSERGATSAHWIVGITWDYFLNVFGRYGTNNNNGAIDVVASDQAKKLNSGFIKQGGHNGHDLIEIGAGDNGVNSTDYATIDVVAHEFTHGVIGYSSQLEYNNESGALNESFCDIFGEAVERYNNGSCNFIHGEEHTSSYFYKRSMSNPSLSSFHYVNGGDWAGSPDTYHGNSWYSGSDDNGGVHINSSVQNFWFYLLSQGGSGINDNGESYSVAGIGIDKAISIAYRNVTNYLNSTANYFTARTHSLIAATDLYGSCSNEVIQVANAWYAVGVGSASQYYDREICGNQTGTPSFYSAINKLSAGSSINCSGTTIKSGAQVVFKSANEIVLLPGFSTETGANFTAYIDPCSISAPVSKMASPKSYSNNYSTFNSISENEVEINNKIMSSPIEEKNGTFNIIPNPNNGHFIIMTNTEQSGTLTITNALGSIIYEERVNGNKTTIDLKNYSKGLYNIRLSTLNGLSFKRVVVQ